MIRTDFMNAVYKINENKLKNSIPLHSMVPIESRRARFHSVKALSNERTLPSLIDFNFSPKKHVIQDQGIKRLEKSLDKQNQRQDPQISEMFTDYQKQQNQQRDIQNKLWAYFIIHAEQFAQKVDKERVNGYSKLMDTIIKETQIKINKISNYVKNMAAVIESKYKQTHQLYDQIHHLKSVNRKNCEGAIRPQMPTQKTNFDNKILLLKQSITHLLRQIEDSDQELKRGTEELNKIKLERISFLRMLLKQGYYREDGVKWILTQMLKINYVPSEQLDMPSFFDTSSRQCLAMEYDNIKAKSKKQTQKRQQKKLPRLINFSSIKNQGQTQIQSNKKHNVNAFAKYRSGTDFLPKKNHLRHVYKEAKSFVEDYLKKKNFGEDKVGQHKPNWLNQILQTKYRWRDQQKARIRNVYSPNTQRKVYRILFGTKLEATYD